MITCNLGDKEYFIPYVSGRALRNIQPALEAYGQVIATVNALSKGTPVPEDTMSVQDAMDRMVIWFCGLFRDQFTPDMFLDLYPADRAMNDLMLAIMAVNQAQTDALSEFPTQAAKTEPKNP